MAFGPMSVGNQATLSLLTDPTLTQENMPADAKATGTRLNALDRGVDDLNKRIVKYLLLTGGTMTGELKAEGGIKGNLTGSATQWNNHTLRKNRATVSGTTWVPVFTDNNVDYATLDDLLREATTRISTLEQKYQAIAKTTEVLLGTVVSPAIKGDTLYKGATHTMATFGSEVAFVKIDTVGKLLRGSSSVKQLWSVYDDPGSYYHYLYVRWDFTTDGRVTATCDRELTDNYAWYANTLKVNINYYSYAVAT